MYVRRRFCDQPQHCEEIISRIVGPLPSPRRLVRSPSSPSRQSCLGCPPVAPATAEVHIDTVGMFNDPYYLFLEQQLGASSSNFAWMRWQTLRQERSLRSAPLFVFCTPPYCRVPPRRTSLTLQCTCHGTEILLLHVFCHSINRSS